MQLQYKTAGRGITPDSHTPLLPRPPRLSACQRFVQSLTSAQGRLDSLGAGTVALASAVEIIARKALATELFHYRWFIVQALTLTNLVICLTLALFNWKRSCKGFKFSKLPFKYLMYSALLDTLHAMCLHVALGVLPGTLGVILSQILIPFAVLLQFYFLGRSTTGKLWVACLTTIAGILLSLLSYSLAWDHNAGTSIGSSFVQPGSYKQLTSNAILLISGILPALLSGAFRQSFLVRHAVDLHISNVFVAFFSFIIGLIFSPLFLELQSLSQSRHNADLFSRPEQIPSDSPWVHLRQGWYCLMGSSSCLGLSSTVVSSDDGLPKAGPSRFAVPVTALLLLLSKWAGSEANSQALELPHGPTVTDAGLTIGSFMALCFFSLAPFSAGLIPGSVWSFPVVAFPVGVVVCITAFIVRAQAPRQESEIDVWEQFEALEAADREREEEEDAEAEAEEAAAAAAAAETETSAASAAAGGETEKSSEEGKVGPGDAHRITIPSSSAVSDALKHHQAIVASQYHRAGPAAKYNHEDEEDDFIGVAGARID